MNGCLLTGVSGVYVQGAVAGDMPGRGEPLALVPVLVSLGPLVRRWTVAAIPDRTWACELRDVSIWICK